MKKIILMMLVLALFPSTVFAADAAAAKTSRSGAIVSVRVESSAPEGEGTLLPSTMVIFGGGGTHTALEALKLAVNNNLTVEHSDYGDYITSICGVGDDTGLMSWMYAVNNELPMEGVDAYELQDGDEIVFYFINWQDGNYAYFTPSALTVTSGESFELTLMGNSFTDGLFPVSGAEIIVTAAGDNIPMTMNIYYTDENGKVRLAFYADATYTISARKSQPDGVSVISRPRCEVTVERAKEFTISVAGGTDTSAPVVVSGDSLWIWKEPKLSLEAPSIQVPVIYNPETGEVWLYGQPLQLDENLQPLYENEVVLLPFRAAAEILGAEVSWNAETATVSAKQGDIEFSFRTGDILNGTPVKIVNGRVYVPAAYFVEQFKLD